MAANTHHAYIKCVHTDMGCKEGEYHLAASGTEEHCNKILEARVADGHEGYVREITESDIK